MELQGEDTRWLAMEIQAEAASRGIYTAADHRSLLHRYAAIMPDVHQRADEALDVLVNDGELERASDGSYHLPPRLLEHWLYARSHDHHVPFSKRTRRPL